MNERAEVNMRMAVKTDDPEVGQGGSDDAVQKPASNLDKLDRDFDIFMSEVDQAAADLRRSAMSIWFRPAEDETEEPPASGPDDSGRSKKERAGEEIIEPDRPGESQANGKAAPGSLKSVDGDSGPIKAEQHLSASASPQGRDGRTNGSPNDVFHRRLGPINLADNLKAGIRAVRRNLIIVMGFTLATNILVLAIPVYLFQISDRVLTSRSVDTLVMLTILIASAVVLNAVLDAIRRFILMRTAVEIAAQLGAPILGAAARAALHSNGREYQTLGDLQQLRSFLVSGTLLAFLDAPLAPLFMLAVFLVHPHLGFIAVVAALLLLVIAFFNQKMTANSFHEATNFQSRANLHLDSMSRNSQIINALAMIPEAVKIWGQDTAGSLKAQVLAQDRNVISASLSKAVRLLAQVAMLGWGAYLSLEGELTGGMVIAASVIAGRALAPVESAIEGWHQFINTRAAYERISTLLKSSPLNFERLKLPRPQGRLDVERLLFVPQGTKRVVLNGVSFTLSPGESLAIIGDSGAGKTTLGKMLVGSLLPTSGNVRLDLMDLRNWDQRQFGENIGYLPQDVQLFPGTIKANIGRMREDASDDDIYKAAMLADVHELISTFAQGYETMVAADGSPLSGGQKQRIALARAFFGNPRMVVLDEPNSNLDGFGDAALLRALSHAKQEKITVITITQRPSLLNCVDKILLLSNGTVSMFGSRQEVLKALAPLNAANVRPAVTGQTAQVA
ncbi:MAG TPA: type I secretion system permease/ATPase [Rhizobiaceae bacterium]|nr:type I secretion system permease/ATPase [Rhizobiaceae bacterium]